MSIAEAPLQQGYLETIHIVNWLLDEKEAWRRQYCRLMPDVLCFFNSERDAQRLTAIQESILIDDIKSVQMFRRRVSITDPTAAAMLYQTSPQSPSHGQDSGKDTLTPLLQDPQRLKEFIKYTEAIYSPENIKFLLAVEEFKKLEDGSSDQKTHAVEIVLNYLVPQSVLELSTIPSEIREEAAEAIDQGAVNKNTFQRLALLTIASLQVNEVPAFLRYLSQVGENRQRMASVQFRIETYGDIGHSGLVVEAPSEEDCRRWISALQTACVKRKTNSNKNSSSPSTSRMITHPTEDIREHGVVVQPSLSMKGALLTKFGIDSHEDLKGGSGKPQKRWWVLVQHKYRPKLVFYKPDDPKVPEGTIYCEDILRASFLNSRKKLRKSSKLAPIDEQSPSSDQDCRSFRLETVAMPPLDLITLTTDSVTEAQTWVGLLSARIHDHRIEEQQGRKKDEKQNQDFKYSSSPLKVSAVINRKATVTAEIRDAVVKSNRPSMIKGYKRSSQISTPVTQPSKKPLPRSKSSIPGSKSSIPGPPSSRPPPSPSHPPPPSRPSHTRSNYSTDLGSQRDGKTLPNHRRIVSDSSDCGMTPSPSSLAFSPLTPRKASPSSSTSTLSGGRPSYSTSRSSPEEPPPPPPPSSGNGSDSSDDSSDSDGDDAPYPASPISPALHLQATKKQIQTAQTTTPPKRPSIRPLNVPSNPPVSSLTNPPIATPPSTTPISPPLPPPKSPPLPPPLTSPPTSPLPPPSSPPSTNFPSPKLPHSSSNLPHSSSNLPQSFSRIPSSASQIPRSGSKIPRSASTIVSPTRVVAKPKPHERTSSVSQLRQSVGLNLNEIEMLHKMGAFPATNLEPELSIPQFYDIPTQPFEGFLRMQDLDPSRPYGEQVKNPWHRRYFIFKPDRFTPAVLIYDNIVDRDQGRISATIYCEDIEDVQIYKGEFVTSLGSIAAKRQRPNRQTQVTRDSITLSPNTRPQSMTVISREARPSFVRGSSRDRCRFEVVTKMGVIPLLGDTYSDTQKWVKLLSACKNVSQAPTASENDGDTKSSKNWQCPICFIIFLPSTPQCERCGGLKPNTQRGTLSSASFAGSGLTVNTHQDQRKTNVPAPSSPTSTSRLTTEILTKEGMLKKKSDRNRHMWEDRYFCFYDDPFAPYVIFFKNQKAKEAGEIAGTIYCQEISRVNRMITGVGSQEKVRFDVETADRVYSLKAPTPKECRLWVDLLTSAVTRQGFTLERGFSASEIRHHQRQEAEGGSMPSVPSPRVVSTSPGALSRSPHKKEKKQQNPKQDLHTYSRELWKKSLPTELEGWLRKQARISRHLWNKRYFQFLNERTGEDEDNIVIRPKLQYFRNERLKQQGQPPKAWLYCDKIKSVHVSRRGGGKLSQERCRFDVETTSGEVWSLIADSYKVCLNWVHLLSYHASQALLSRRVSTTQSPAPHPRKTRKETKHKPKLSLPPDPHVRLISGIKPVNGRQGGDDDGPPPRHIGTPSSPPHSNHGSATNTLTRSLPSAGATPIQRTGVGGRTAGGVGTAPAGHDDEPEVGSRGEPYFVAGSKSGYA